MRHVLLLYLIHQQTHVLKPEKLSITTEIELPPQTKMVRNIVVLGGSSHPTLNETICENLGIQLGAALFSKFAVGETRVEIKESVRGKDVYIIQSGGGKVNDHFIELCIAISACKTASAKKVTAVLPLFPYSRQSDIPYNKSGAPLVKASNVYNKPDFVGNHTYTFDSIPSTPHPDKHTHSGGSMEGLNKALSRSDLNDPENSPTHQARYGHYQSSNSSSKSENALERTRQRGESSASLTNGVADHDFAATKAETPRGTFKPQPGYRQWVAQAGTLVADLLTCAGADQIITMDLHDPQYQGFFDIPVDNLYGRPLLKKYIKNNIHDLKNCIIVSPDAGGAKRATALAETLGVEFALIHKERRPTKITDRQNATMMLVGDVTNKTVILIDDLADTSNTITRAAKLLKKEGASKVYALITHGVLSGDAIERINASALDKVVVTNTVDQRDHAKRCPKLEVLDVGHVFAEVCSNSSTLCQRLLTMFRQYDEFITERASVYFFNMIEPIADFYLHSAERTSETKCWRGRCNTKILKIPKLLDANGYQSSLVLCDTGDHHDSSISSNQRSTNDHSDSSSARSAYVSYSSSSWVFRSDHCLILTSSSAFLFTSSSVSRLNVTVFFPPLLYWGAPPTPQIIPVSKLILNTSPDTVVFTRSFRVCASLFLCALFTIFAGNTNVTLGTGRALLEQLLGSEPGKLNTLETVVGFCDDMVVVN